MAKQTSPGVVLSLICQSTSPFFCTYFALVFLASRDHFASTPTIVLVSVLLFNSFLSSGLYFGACNAICRLRQRRLYFTIFHILLAVFFLSNFLYLAYFGALFSLFALSQMAQLATVSEQILVFFGRWLVFFLIVVVGTLVWQLRLLPRVASSSIGMKAVPLLLVLVLAKHFLVGSTRVTGDTFFENYSQSRGKTTALYGFSTVYSADALVFQRYQARDVVYPVKIVEGVAESESLGWRPGRYNVISIQVESLDYGILSQRTHDGLVMPFVNRLTENSVVFGNFFAQHGAGGSSDSELSYFTGLLPVDLLGGLSTSRFEDIETLPKILQRHGYEVVGLHANSGNYYNRERAYELLGFRGFLDADDFEGSARGWHAKDIEFFRQGVEKVTRLPKPFFAHFITNQSHGPFENNVTDLQFVGTGDERALFKSYMETMREVDQAIETFFELLSQYGLYESTIVLIFGDHTAVPQDPFRYEGKQMTPLERVPLIVHHPSLSGEMILKAGSHVDLAPTVLSLVGISEHPEWLGRSLLTEGPGMTLVRRDQLYVIRSENGVLAVTPAEGLSDEKFRYYRSFFDYSAAKLY